MELFKLQSLMLGMIQTNCYVVSNQITKQALVFDPGDEADKIYSYLQQEGLTCVAILLTHGHFDHIMAVEELKSLTKAKVYAHEEEVQLLGDAKLNASHHVRKVCELLPDILLKDQQFLELAGFKMRVIHTPGHTRGGVCYYFPEYETLISGDTLFRESIGRTDLPTGDTNTLVAVVNDKLMLLEDQVKVYPGHGFSTTIGHERKHNPYI